MRLPILLSLTAAFCATALLADMPAGAGRDETLKVCGKCHSPEQAASLHQSRSAWEETVSKMVGMGAEGTDDEYSAILDYLTKNFGPEGTHPVSINKATAVELEAALGLSRTESAAIVSYRAAKGDFKTFDDLKSVPGLDFKKIDDKKTKITF
ncbi:MAG: helix-hairpin-helix domain-containing protein [Terriglobia bacterium]